MEQITPEIKVRVFSLYLGQQAIITKGTYTRHKDSTHKIDSKVIGAVEMEPILKFRHAILVDPLSSITDEDAIEIAKIFNIGHLRGATVPLIKSILSAIDGTTPKSATTEFVLHWLAAHDYLRSKGYALPAYGFNVDELVEAGVFKLKEVNND